VEVVEQEQTENRAVVKATDLAAQVAVIE